MKPTTTAAGLLILAAIGAVEHKPIGIEQKVEEPPVLYKSFETNLESYKSENEGLLEENRQLKSTIELLTTEKVQHLQLISDLEAKLAAFNSRESSQIQPVQTQPATVPVYYYNQQVANCSNGNCGFRTTRRGLFRRWIGN